MGRSHQKKASRRCPEHPKLSKDTHQTWWAHSEKIPKWRDNHRFGTEYDIGASLQFTLHTAFLVRDMLDGFTVLTVLYRISGDGASISQRLYPDVAINAYSGHDNFLRHFVAWRRKSRSEKPVLCDELDIDPAISFPRSNRFSPSPPDISGVPYEERYIHFLRSCLCAEYPTCRWTRAHLRGDRRFATSM